MIATEGSNIGMGGPAMIEGGGLGVVAPEEIGPLDVQVANGVVDVAVADEAEAVAVAEQFLSYFGPRRTGWTCDDQSLLRSIVPEQRTRIYDIREVITGLADLDSVLELRPGFAPGMITSLIRVEGRSVGVVANNPAHQAGAIESDGADKAARFLQLCDAFDVPILFLCDTPGIMVGPDAEETALVRHASRLFVVGANLSVPFFTIVVRKGYGLGAQAMAGGASRPRCSSSPGRRASSGEWGSKVRSGWGTAASSTPSMTLTNGSGAYQDMVDRAYQQGKALNAASWFEIDDVIDPADSRRWITRTLDAAPDPSWRTRPKRTFVDTW